MTPVAPPTTTAVQDTNALPLSPHPPPRAFFFRGKPPTRMSPPTKRVSQKATPAASRLRATGAIGDSDDESSSDRYIHKTHRGVLTGARSKTKSFGRRCLKPKRVRYVDQTRGTYDASLTMPQEIQARFCASQKQICVLGKPGWRYYERVSTSATLEAASSAGSCCSF